jgi:hypothetical protein
MFGISLDSRGQEGGMIKTIMVAMVILIVLGWVVNTVANSIGTANDNLGVMAGLVVYGPTIVTMIFIGLFILAVAALIQYLRM